nr:hypothetical protein Iba_chr12aCG11110 [Ipomoea batatas]
MQPSTTHYAVTHYHAAIRHPPYSHPLPNSHACHHPPSTKPPCSHTPPFVPLASHAITLPTTRAATPPANYTIMSPAHHPGNHTACHSRHHARHPPSRKAHCLPSTPCYLSAVPPTIHAL